MVESDHVICMLVSDWRREELALKDAGHGQYKVLTVVKFQLLSNNYSSTLNTQSLVVARFIGIQFYREMLLDNGATGHCDV